MTVIVLTDSIDDSTNLPRRAEEESVHPIQEMPQTGQEGDVCYAV